MAYWLGRGHPALLEAFENVCGRIDQEIRAEDMLSKKPLMKDASTCTEVVDEAPIRDQLAVLDRLREENEKLRSELATLTAPKGREGTSELTVPGTSTRAVSLPVASLSQAEAPDVSHSELAVLRLKYVALNNNFKIAREALERRKRERDDSRGREFLLMSKIRAAEEKYHIRIIEKGAISPRTGASAVPEEEALDLPPPPRLSPAMAIDSSIQGDDVLQSTQGDLDEEEPQLPPLRLEDKDARTAVKQEPSSDTPIVISERVLKRKRAEPDMAPADDYRQVKDESGDIEVISRCEVLEHPTQESLDLDNIAQRMTTPRKRRQAEDVQQQQAGRQGSPLLTPNPNPYSTRLDYPASDVRGESSVFREESSILTPVSGNGRLARVVHDANQTPTTRPRLTHGIEELAEDGGAYGRGDWRRDQNKLDRPLTVEQVQGGGRLRNLLSKSPRNDAEFAADQRAPGVLQSQFEVPQRRELPFEQPGKEFRRKDLSSRTTPRAARPDQADHPPVQAGSAHASKPRALSSLRSKPLAELRLDDFKINPAANQGHDFAFSEVVRDKDDRANLRGCTDMHCCGKEWRAMALSQRPDGPLTAAQRQEEQKLLEKYLGDCSYRLAGMTKEERAELWVEAKTEELANRFGKHRHNFPRMQSPPGFWNADFPDTQQLASEKQEAEKREKQAISERYREATRPRGRWLFRDE